MTQKTPKKSAHRNRLQRAKGPSKPTPSRSRHHKKPGLTKVSGQTPKKAESASTNNHEGMVMLGFTAKQLEVRQVLLEPGVSTYFHAARRLGITENAIKKRMSASNMQVVKARQVVKEDEEWHRRRRLAKKGVFSGEEKTN